MKPWHKNYPKKVAFEIDVNKYESLIDIFDTSIVKYKSKIAYQSFGAKLTFSEVDSLSNNFAAYLQTELGVKKGDRIALMSPNCLAFIVAMWGIIKIGAVQVNVNPLYTARELQHQLNDADVNTIVAFAGSTSTLAEIMSETSIKNVVIAQLNDLVNKGIEECVVDSNLEATTTFLDSLEIGKNLKYEKPSLEHSDLLFLQYTGGTTGLSKGAMLTHGNLVANILQFQELTKNILNESSETVITAIPIYHIFALTVNCLSFFSLGGSNVLITNPQDMPLFVETWRKNNPTVFTGVNTLFNGLLHTSGFNEINFSELKMSMGGGAPVQQIVSDKWRELTGRRIDEGYGLSETSPILTINFGTDKIHVPGIGIPAPSTDISLRDEKGDVVANGEPGELCAKGPQIMKGYWRNEAATKESMTDDGYFKTGDVAILDELGFFHIVDRKKDMILVSGFNVFPNEIEAEASKMPGILECACVGVENEKTGEAVKLFAVKNDSNVTADQLIAFCREKLAAYKVPKQVVFIENLPKSNVGKILRRELR